MAWERGSSFACRISFLNLRFSCEGPNVSFKLKFLEVVNKLTDETVQKFSYEWTWLLKLINNSLRKYKGNQCLMSVWKSDETLLSICILNFTFKNDFVWEEISNIRRSVSSPDETPRSSERILARWLVESYGLFSKNQLVVYYQCCVLIGWASTGLYVIAEACNPLGVICFWL